MPSHKKYILAFGILFSIVSSIAFAASPNRICLLAVSKLSISDGASGTKDYRISDPEVLKDLEAFRSRVGVSSIHNDSKRGGVRIVQTGTYDEMVDEKAPELSSRLDELIDDLKNPSADKSSLIFSFKIPVSKFRTLEMPKNPVWHSGSYESLEMILAGSLAFLGILGTNLGQITSDYGSSFVPLAMSLATAWLQEKAMSYKLENRARQHSYIQNTSHPSLWYYEGVNGDLSPEFLRKIFANDSTDWSEAYDEQIYLNSNRFQKFIAGLFERPPRGVKVKVDQYFFRKDTPTNEEDSVRFVIQINRDHDHSQAKTLLEARPKQFLPDPQELQKYEALRSMSGENHRWLIIKDAQGMIRYLYFTRSDLNIKADQFFEVINSTPFPLSQSQLVKLTEQQFDELFSAVERKISNGLDPAVYEVIYDPQLESMKNTGGQPSFRWLKGLTFLGILAAVAITPVTTSNDIRQTRHSVIGALTSPNYEIRWQRLRSNSLWPVVQQLSNFRELSASAYEHSALRGRVELNDYEESLRRLESLMGTIRSAMDSGALPQDLPLNFVTINSSNIPDNPALRIWEPDSWVSFDFLRPTLEPVIQNDPSQNLAFSILTHPKLTSSPNWHRWVDNFRQYNTTPHYWYYAGPRLRRAVVAPTHFDPAVTANRILSTPEFQKIYDEQKAAESAKARK